ncbi:hypothetical protein ACP275_06G191900 [Erythranthe tilingii]
MSNITMKNLVPLLVVFANIYLMMFVNMTSGCGVTDEYEVHVTNRLPSPQLRLHCASKNDDLGYHNIDRDYDFNWRFCENWTGNTLFFCHLWWNNSDIAFDVFKSQDHDNPCLRGKCYWEARTDGIYFSGGQTPSDFQKKYDWNKS